MRRFYLNDCKKYIAFCQEDSSWQNHLLDLADKACDNTFIFTDRYEMERCTTPVRFDGKIDWNHIPFDDDEWCFAFNRHTFLLNLAKAFCLTGNDKYRDAWIRLFTDFCDNTAPEGESRRLCWRSLECGIRVENYLRSLEFFEDIVTDTAAAQNEIFYFFMGLVIVRQHPITLNHVPIFVLFGY